MNSGLPPDVRTRYIDVLHGFEAGGGFGITRLSKEDLDAANELKAEGFFAILHEAVKIQCPDGSCEIGPAWEITPKGRSFLAQLRKEVQEDLRMTISRSLPLDEQTQRKDVPVMSSPSIFISHAAEDKEVAKAFKAELSAAVQPNAVRIFVSSDNGISCGDNPMDSIQKTAVDSNVVISLLTPCSIEKPWILFEAGAAWGREIKLLPLYFGGITPNDLPHPIKNNFQAKNATNSGELAQAIASLGKTIGIHIGIDSSVLAETFKNAKITVPKKPNALIEKKDLSDKALQTAFENIGGTSVGILQTLYENKGDPVELTKSRACVNKLCALGIIFQSEYGGSDDYELRAEVREFIETHPRVKRDILGYDDDDGYLDDDGWR